MAAPSSTEVLPRAAQFPLTLWSLVLAARDGAPERSLEALTSLCRAYWYPLYAFLRRQGKSPHDAEDLTQGFFLHLLGKNKLAQVSPERGRFRSFLITSIKNFLSDEWSRSRAQKRGGAWQFVSFELTDAENQYRTESPQVAPENLFDRRWALVLLERVLKRLETEFAAAGKKERFEHLKPFLSGESQEESYAAVASRLGMTAGALKVAVVRLRQRYRELLRLEVAQTVATEQDVDAEIHHLMAVLRG